MKHNDEADRGARGKENHRRAVCAVGTGCAACLASWVLFTTLLATTVGLPRAYAERAGGKGGSAAVTMTPAQTSALSRSAAPAAAMSERGRAFYMKRFGVDELRVRRLSSGAMLEFRYLVVDPEKAKLLTDKKATPVLIDQKTRRKVGVPFMENVGTLRQSPTPVAGREYWMVFENPNKAIQAGSHVDITIGGFHVSGLVVE